MLETALAEWRLQMGRRASARGSFSEQSQSQSRSTKSSRHPSGAGVDHAGAAELQASGEAVDLPSELPDMAQIIDASRWKLKWSETHEELAQAKSALCSTSSGHLIELRALCSLCIVLALC